MSSPDTPKSQSLIWPSLVTRTFEGLMSAPGRRFSESGSEEGEKRTSVDDLEVVEVNESRQHLWNRISGAKREREGRGAHRLSNLAQYLLARSPSLGLDLLVQRFQTPSFAELHANADLRVVLRAALVRLFDPSKRRWLTSSRKAP